MTYDIITIMQRQWPLEKAQKYIRIAGFLLILSGIFTLVLSIDDFVILGARTSVFILPYLINIIFAVIAGFQIYLGIVLKNTKWWVKIAVYCLLGLRTVLFVFDYEEFLPTFILLFYLIYIFRSKKAGWLFNEQQ